MKTSALAAEHEVGHLLGLARAELQAAGVETPWLNALVLLEEATRLGRTTLLARPEGRVTPGQVAQFRELVRRRCRREPLAYILGYREFFGRRFAVSPTTLIPRPETEGLVALALECLDHLRDVPPILLDVATGSGAVAVSVLAERPAASAVATDLLPTTLAIARENAQKHGVSTRLKLVACDLTSAIQAKFPVVVGNLPYVPTPEVEALDPEIAEYEPHAALDGGLDGTEVIRRFLASLPGVMARGGCAFLEIGHGQATTLRRHAAGLPDCTAETRRDGAGIERFLVITRAES